MKKKAVIIIIIAVVILILAGAGVFYFMHKKNVEDNSFVATQTAICIKKDGTVVEAGIEEFDSTIYDQLELDTFIRGEVADYNTSVGAEKIKVQQITVENNVATMYLEYSSPQDYAAFHGETFFVGTMQEAIEAGYMENIEFYAVYEETLGRKMTVEEISAEGLKVLVMKEHIGVYIKGKMHYISSNMKVIDKNTAFPDENVPDTGGYIVVIFEQ